MALEIHSDGTNALEAEIYVLSVNFHSSAAYYLLLSNKATFLFEFNDT